MDFNDDYDAEELADLMEVERKARKEDTPDDPSPRLTEPCPNCGEQHHDLDAWTIRCTCGEILKRCERLFHHPQWGWKTEDGRVSWDGS